MNRLDLLTLMESERKTLLKNVGDANSKKIVGLFEATGLLKRGEATTDKAPTRSKRPDIMEMDADSKGGMYDASIREEPKQSGIIPKKSDEPKEKTPKAEPKKKTGPKSEPTQEPPVKEEVKPEETEQLQETTQNTIVDKSSGYPEIQLSEDLKDVDEKELDNVLNKNEVDAVLTANNDAKLEVFRNLLMIKKSDFGGSSEYECFTTGKGGTKMVKGLVPDTYLSKYYASKSEIQRPDTKEAYLIFSAKLKGSEEQLKAMTLPDNTSKYIVFTSDSNNNSEYITVLDKSEFDMLFHQVIND